MPRRIGAAISHSRHSSADEIDPSVAQGGGRGQASAAREIFASRSRKRECRSAPLLDAQHARIGEGRQQGCYALHMKITSQIPELRTRRVTVVSALLTGLSLCKCFKIFRFRKL
jgi:hypothetical protein